VRREIEEADILALFLDYDGTLVPFKDKPEEAVATDDVYEALRALVLDPKCTVAIISGRAVKDLEKMLSVKGLSLAGLHGLEIRFSDGRNFIWEKSKETETAIKEIKRKTIRELGCEGGLHIEDKRLTLALHYRLLPREKVQEVTKRFIEITEEHLSKNDLEIMRGVKVLEVRPRGWHKGKALGEFFKRFLPGDKKILPLYVGDDLTDEDAFLYLKGWGITVCVLRDPYKPTAAKYHLIDTSEVLEFLSWIHCVIRASKENVR
jgi:trehalose-phosphatase